MTTVTGTPPITQTSSTSSSTKTEETKTKAATADTIKDFQAFLSANIVSSKATEVSEEELFAASIGEVLTGLKGADISKKYAEELEKHKSAMTKSNGYIPYEDAAKKALGALVKEGTLTEEEGDAVYSQAFDAAQLDGNTSVLFDGIGGANDPTKAVAAIEQALLGARTKITGFTDGTQKYSTRKLTEQTMSFKDIMASGLLGSGSAGLTATGLGGATGTPVSGSFTPNGTNFSTDFLFKPASSTDGKLAIITPFIGSDQVDLLELLDSEGKVIEQGRYTSRGGDDGNSGAKFAFSQSGNSYPKNLTVRVTYANGAVQSYLIPDPGKRHEG